jgi:hypothetical protein
MIQAFHLLFDLVSPKADVARDATQTERLVAAITGFLASIAFAALWGIAAGTHAGTLALGNVLKVPMLLVVSSVAALPIGAFVWKLTASAGRVGDLFVAHAMATFVATLTLALFAPLVALYQHSSSWAGPIIASASSVAAVGIGIAIMLRVLGKLAPTGQARRSFVLPVAIMFVVQIAALAQLASITTPVFPERTPFGRGIDGLIDPATQVSP